MSDSVAEQLGQSTTVTSLSLYAMLSRENVQQLKFMLRRNTVLEYLLLASSALGSAGLAEIAPVLYRNTSIKYLDLSSNGLYDIESANLLRELIHRNKTITSLFLIIIVLVTMLPLFGGLRRACVAIQLCSSLIFAVAA
jgi:hypothetical protein